MKIICICMAIAICSSCQLTRHVDNEDTSIVISPMAE